MDTKTVKGASVDRRNLMKAAAFVAAAAPAASAAARPAPEPQPPAAPPVPALGGGQPTAPLFFTVDTTAGKVMGMANGPVKIFNGIPYAAPTGGKNRYMPPKKVTPWKGVRECFSHGQISPQTISSLASDYGQMIMWDCHYGTGMGEDVCNLNVWTTSVDKSAKKAVLVSFHGGGWATGSGNFPGFDGSQMAKFGDVVVVTISHRLGTFGYLNLVDNGAPAAFESAGVCGVQDMVASLEWVRDNIENFGGDKNRVMIFGQSGGGAKTSTMLATPAAKGLFHRAAVQSGSTIRLGDREAAARSTATLLEKLGLKGKAAGIQNVSWQAILQAGGAGSPFLDGKYFTHHPFDPGAPMESADVPVIISTTLHDSALSLTNWDLDGPGLRRIVAERFGDANADRIIAAQKAARPQDTPYLTQASILTDASRGRGALVQAERKAALGRAATYVYEWDWGTNACDGKFGAVHGHDVSASFYNCRDQIAGSGSAEGRLMSSRLAGAWAAFAKTGNPSHPGIGTWTPYTAQSKAIMVFDKTTRVVPDHRGDLIRMLANATPAAGATPAGRGGGAGRGGRGGRGG